MNKDNEKVCQNLFFSNIKQIKEIVHFVLNEYQYKNAHNSLKTKRFKYSKHHTHIVHFVFVPIIGFSRDEFEYEIPINDAKFLLQNICLRPTIEKTRYKFPYKGFVWEIDEFRSENDGLIIALILMRLVFNRACADGGRPHHTVARRRPHHCRQLPNALPRM